MYQFATRIGIFTIRSGEREKWDLWIDDTKLGIYSSPLNAADDVFKRETGWDEWDNNIDIEPPEDISRWEETPEPSGSSE